MAGAVMYTSVAFYTFPFAIWTFTFTAFSFFEIRPLIQSPFVVYLDSFAARFDEGPQAGNGTA